jgi:hypothetical protein
MLSDGDVFLMREEFESLLPDTANVQRRTATSDGGGGNTYTYANVLTGVACRISPIKGGEGGNGGGRVMDETTHVITFAAKTDVRHPDRIVVSGITYEVTYVRTRGDWELTRRVEAKELP